MATIIATGLDDAGNPLSRAYIDNDAARGSAVSWAAVFAGAAAAAAMSLVLLVLGVGLGLSAVSPWSQSGIAAGTFGVSTIVWICFTALLASGLGGYLAGRLRVKWAAVHTDEVYFRDTAHGFLTWAVATLLTAGLLSSVVGAIGAAATDVVATGASAVATGGLAAASAKGDDGVSAVSRRMRGPDRNVRSEYMTDTLFRAAPAVANQSVAAPVDARAEPIAPGGMSAGKAEAGRIFANGMRTGQLSAEDTRYAAQLIAQRTGISQQDAEKRVTDTFSAAQAKLREAETTAKEAAEQARKAASYASLWLFVSLLIGAFAASLMATYGGRRRDLY